MVQSDLKYLPFKVFNKSGKPYIRVKHRGERKELVCIPFILYTKSHIKTIQHRLRKKSLLWFFFRWRQLQNLTLGDSSTTLSLVSLPTSMILNGYRVCVLSFHFIFLLIPCFSSSIIHRLRFPGGSGASGSKKYWFFWCLGSHLFIFAIIFSFHELWQTIWNKCTSTRIIINIWPRKTLLDLKKKKVIILLQTYGRTH